MALVLLEMVWPVVGTPVQATEEQTMSAVREEGPHFKVVKTVRDKLRLEEESTAANKGAREVDRWPLGKRDHSVDSDSVTWAAHRPAHRPPFIDRQKAIRLRNTRRRHELTMSESEKASFERKGEEKAWLLF